MKADILSFIVYDSYGPVLEPVLTHNHMAMPSPLGVCSCRKRHFMGWK